MSASRQALRWTGAGMQEAAGGFLRLEARKQSSLLKDALTKRFLLSLLLIAWGAEACAQCAPGANQAAFFKDSNFQGPCSVRGLGDYPTASATGLPNDSISSIRLGPDTKVYVCRDQFFGGVCETITADVASLRGHAVGNDQITSFRVQTGAGPADCAPGASQASFFIDSNFAGSCVTRSIGSYPTAQSIGLPNDSISSVRLGAGAQVFICRDDHFQGPCEVIQADTPSLGGHTVGNDQITSAKVQAVGTAEDCAPASTEAAFYRDINFSGPCEVLGPGAYPTSDAIGLANDSISSVRVGAAAQAIVCKDVNFSGDCEKLTSDVADMRHTRIGNDAVSSARVEALGAQDCAPGANQVGFFMHSSFVAPCTVRGLGDYPTAAQIGLPNDSISSVLIGSGAQAVLCIDINFGRDCEVMRANVPDLNATRIGGDRVSSAKVQLAGTIECNPGPLQVSFFEHSDFVAPCTTRDLGDYPTAESIGLPNDSLSSVRVGSAAQVEVCEDVNFGGDCQRLTSSVSDMARTRVGNDTVTSARVQRAGDVDCPPMSNQASVYKNSDFVAPCVTKGIGDYPNPAAMGIEDNSISSIRVGDTVQVCACEAVNFGNVCEAFTANASSLSGHFASLGGGNDIISSFRVQNRGQTCQAIQTSTGYSQVQATNCHPEMHSVNFWMRDDTIGGDYIDQGSLASQWSNGGCPVGSPKMISLKDQHLFDFIVVDPAWCGGQNDPHNLSCQKGTFGPIRGMDNGPAFPYQVQ